MLLWIVEETMATCWLFGAAVWALFVLEALVLPRDVEGEDKVTEGPRLPRSLELFIMRIRSGYRRVGAGQLFTGIVVVEGL